MPLVAVSAGFARAEEDHMPEQPDAGSVLDFGKDTRGSTIVRRVSVEEPAEAPQDGAEEA